MVDFDHLGYDLNRCGGILDGIQNFIQTCLHHKGPSINDVGDFWPFLTPQGPLIEPNRLF